MNQSNALISGFGFVAAAAIGLGCPGKKEPAPEAAPTPLTELVIKKVSADLSKPDPNAAFWNDVPSGSVKLLAQPMITPKPEKLTTEQVVIQAVHDGTKAAFRIRWKDSEKSEAGRLSEFSDAFALEFPVSQSPLPPVMMGAKGQPVHLFHWRAQYQRDQEKGKPTMKDLYPNASIDMYPHEFASTDAGSATAAEKYSPGVAIGNPQSYAKNGVDEIIAEGFATSAVQQGHGSHAKGEWKEGQWTLVLVRPLAVEGGSNLKVGESGNVAFAVWQGGHGEVGSRKAITMAWTPVKVQ